MPLLSEETLVDVVNEILFPGTLLRDEAARALLRTGLTGGLIRQLRWRDVLRHAPPDDLIIQTPGVWALRMDPMDATPKFSAWVTYSAERQWRTDPDHFIFMPTRNLRYAPTEAMTGAELGRLLSQNPDGFHEPTYKDRRDIAVLCLARALGRRGKNPATIAQTRWGELEEGDFDDDDLCDNPWTSLEGALDEWSVVWESIAGRDFDLDDPILIPASARHLRWEADRSSRWTRPRPVSLKVFYRVFRERGAIAGHPSLSAPDCMVKSDINVSRDEASF